MQKSKDWKAVDQLADEQKFEEARTRVAAILATAIQTSNTADWTLGLIRSVQLEVGLHGYETAVRFLREQPWPKDALSHTALELFYAHCLMEYLSAYSYEIGRREKVVSQQAVDLKSWTREQIFLEASQAYERLWQRRAELGQMPVATLADYVTPNNYPPHIRGTLRDTLSYLYANHLADTAGYTPQQSNETFRLPFELLATGSAQAEPPHTAAAGEHPLVRLARVLSDLEAWHTAHGRAEAALEARLVRLEKLRGSFAQKNHLAVMIRYLSDELLPAHRKEPWWSKGQAFLASLWNLSGDKVVGHKLAQIGASAYPDSYGGLSCAAMVRSIEGPDFQIQSMLIDGAHKRSIQVSHKNMPRLYFRAYDLDLRDLVESETGHTVLPHGEKLAKLIRRRPTLEWSADLPATPDYEMHTTYVTPPLKGPGAYVVMASFLPDFSEAKNRVQSVNLILTDLLLHTRTSGPDLEVTVVSAETGQPVPGAQVMLFEQNWRDKHKLLRQGKTDGKGLAQFGAQPQKGVLVYAELGDDRTLDVNTFHLGHRYSESYLQRTLVYTDRSIYRPKQKLFYKVAAYQGHAGAGDLRIAPNTSFDVRLLDPNHQVVLTEQVRTNEFGTAHGEFVIPEGRLLGQWRVETMTYSGTAFVRVEEYKRPTFEVSLLDPKAALRLNQVATFKGEAKYYFGLPVTAGRVKWRVKRQHNYPWWWGFWGLSTAHEEQTVATGESELTADGSFELSFTPLADETLSKEVTYRYAVSADLTDEGGETRSAQRSFRLGFAAVEAVINTDIGFFGAPDAPAPSFEVRRTNLDGSPRQGNGTYQVLALKQPDKTLTPAEQARTAPPGVETKPGAFFTPGDKLLPRWDRSQRAEQILASFADGAVVADGKLEHGADGLAKVQLSKLPPGAYRLRYKTQDEFSQTAQTWRDFIVAGPKPAALPLLVVAERTQVRVGDRVRVLVTSGLADQTLFFEIHREGKLVDRRLLSPKQQGIIELPLAETDRGGFGVHVFGFRDHQFFARDLSISVPWDNKELALSFVTLRDKLRPGQKEVFRVAVRGPKNDLLGKGMVELLSYMYDRSLDLFAPHSPPNPIHLFPNRYAIAHGRPNLETAHPNWVYSESLWQPLRVPTLNEDSLNFPENYGIGGPGRSNRHVTRGGFLGRVQSAAAPGGPAPPPPPSPMRKASPAKEVALPETESASSGKDGKADAASKRSDDPAQAASGPEGSTLRSNFSETAFFAPNLVTEADGSAAIEFTVPDSVTSWNVWVHAMTRDLASASLRKEVRSVKELMVRPYLPRFFREKDSAELKVMVNNAGDKKLSGKVTLEIFDPETQQNLLPLFQVRSHAVAFAVEAGKGTSVTFPLSTPPRVGTVAFKVMATAGDFTDGELRPVPVLPSRMHLAQSRFVTLRDQDSRKLAFADMARDDDPSLLHEQLVVTLDTQLFYTVLKALPYLTHYPYECTEQTLNRFLSTGIVSSVYREFPQVKKAAEEFSKRATPLEPWDAHDPNRKMSLEETPWLVLSKGGRQSDFEMINTLDAKIAAAHRDAALAKLRKTQTASGGFPWFSGGPPSPYITLYLLHGFARAAEFRVEVPKDMVQRAWSYLGDHYRSDLRKLIKKGECCWEFLTLLNYVASAYPDPSYSSTGLSDSERKEILDYTFQKWKAHSPYIKGLLALTLKRMGRAQDAKLVWDSVMDSAKTEPDQGTHFAREDRSWLWYNDTIETHAFALRVLMELDPKNPKKDGLVLWLLLNKKTNQWKSTRATAEVIYSLVHYLRAEQALGVREEAKVHIGPTIEQFTFEPERYVGKTQILLPGAQIEPQKHHTITVEKATKGYLFASATWHFSTDKLPEEARGDFFQIERKYFLRQNNGKEWSLSPLQEGAAIFPGDEIEVQLSLRSKHESEYVHLRDPRAAGLEPENAVSRYKWDLGLGFYEEVRDSGTNFFFERLPAGQYTFKYRLRANLAGRFRVGPAQIQSMYAPEFTAYSAGHMIHIGSK